MYPNDHHLFGSLARPAIEPIYFSLPATLHLSLLSFSHFTFLLHIRLSPHGTPNAMDVVPEACHTLIQLGPGLLPLLPRAAIAIVILTAFRDAQTLTNRAINRDPNFFNVDSGQLTTYAKSVLIIFVSFIAIRIVLVVLSTVGLWVSSPQPLGGLIGSRFRVQQDRPRTPRKTTLRDPAQTRSPRKSGVSEENEFRWEWRERTRSRIQDAFELCIIRQRVGRDAPVVTGSVTQEMEQRRTCLALTIPISSVTGPEAEPSVQTTNTSNSHSDPPAKPRPNSEIEAPTGFEGAGSSPLDMRLPGASTSSHDLFYTPMDHNTPDDDNETTLPHAEPSRDYAPSRTVGPVMPTEFGVLPESKTTGDALNHADDDDSVGLLASDSSQKAAATSERSSRSISSTSSSSLRKEAMPNPRQVNALHRARSTSVRLLRDATSSGFLVRRVKSGTILDGRSQYSRLDDTTSLKVSAGVRWYVLNGRAVRGLNLTYLSDVAGVILKTESAC